MPSPPTTGVREAQPAASAATSPRPSGRLVHVDALRGLFCMIIVLAHGDGRLLPGAFAALDGFFVASGLVIGLLLLREHSTTGRVDLVNFYLRRGRRLLPNLAAMLSFTALGTLLLLSPFGVQASTARTGLFASFQVSNLDLYRAPSGYFDPGSRHVPLLHTWSLSMQEQVYLVLPATLIVASLIATRSRLPTLRAFIAVTAVTSAISFVIFLLWASGEGALPGLTNVHRAAYYFPLSRWWEVGLGVLLACWYVGGSPLPRRLAAACALGGLVSLTILMISPVAAPDQRTGPLLLIPIGAVVLLLVGCRDRVTVTSRVLGWRPLLWVGERAYAWFLFHYPVIVFARAWFGDTPTVSTIAALSSLAPALVAYELIEKRLRYPPRGQPRRAFVVGTSAVVACSILIPVGLFVTVGEAGHRLAALPAVAHMAEQIEPRRVADTMGCSDPGAAFAPRRCTLNADGSGAPIYLVGDSTAGMHSPALEILAREFDSPLVLLNRSSCPFVDLAVHFGADDGRDCVAAVRERSRWLRTQPPGVLFTTSDEQLSSMDGVTFEDVGTGEVATSTEARERTWRDALLRTFAPLTAHGHHLVVVAPLPHPGAADSLDIGWEARTCPLLRIVADASSCGRSVPKSQAREDVSVAAANTAWLAGRLGGEVVDVFDALCPTSTCRTNVGDEWTFHDSKHITTEASLALTGELRTPLAAAIRRVPDAAG